MMSLAARPYTPTARAMFFTACSPRSAKDSDSLSLICSLAARVDADAARLGQRFEPRGNVDAVAENVVAVDDDVADIDADPENDPLVVRDVRIAPQHRALHFHGKRDSIDHAGEFEQHAVAGGLDDAAVMLRYRRVDQLPAMRLQRGERTDLVDAHQATVADRIGGSQHHRGESGCCIDVLPEPALPAGLPLLIVARLLLLIITGLLLPFG